MDRNFPACLRLVLREEGGNIDHPADPGGRTSRGITNAVWQAWRKTHPGLPSDVYQAPQSAVEDIYRVQYWEPYCGKMPSGIDLVFFDFCVNAGRQQAARTLQRALGVNPDGMMGVITWDALADQTNQVGETAALIRRFSQKRRDFYKELRTYSTFGKGWMSRTNRIEQAALKMVVAPSEVPTTTPIPPVTEAPKADPKDTKQPPVSTETATQVGTGMGLVGLLTWLWERFEHLSEGTLNKLIDLAQKPAFWFICAMVGIFVYIWWVRRQQKRIEERV